MRVSRLNVIACDLLLRALFSWALKSEWLLLPSTRRAFLGGPARFHELVWREGFKSFRGCRNPQGALTGTNVTSRAQCRTPPCAGRRNSARSSAKRIGHVREKTWLTKSNALTVHKPDAGLADLLTARVSCRAINLFRNQSAGWQSHGTAPASLFLG